MKITVTYSSKYGFTKRYADKIAELLGAELVDMNHANEETFKTSDVIIHGGGIYEGKVLGCKKLAKYFDIIKEKKIVGFSVGLADGEKSKDVIEKWMKKSCGEDLYSIMKCYYFRGGLDYSIMSLADKALMGMMRTALLAKGYKNLNENYKTIVDSYGEKVDFVDTGKVLPLVEYVKSLCSE